MTPDPCPAPADLAAFHAGDLRPDAIERVAAHLEGCPACEAAVAALDGRTDPLAGDLRGAAAGPPTDSHPGPPAAGAGTLVAGRYKLVEPVGEGGMGEVWLAQQTEPVRRAVAVKLVKPGMDSRQVLARFEQERQALALMDHPNIAKVLDAGTTDAGRPFFAMELVKGVPITAYCDRHRLTPRERLALFVPVCQAVQHAHQKGVIHRDLKPSNILVARYDGVPVPKVIDFGVAKATGQPLTDKTLVTGLGAVVGTPEYMAPEQAELNQLDVDTRADVYALGVLLYELLTGTTPLTRARLGRAALLEVLRLVREEEPPPPSSRLSAADALPSIAANRGTEPRRLAALLKGELDWVALKALDKDRDRRYETAAGLARDVQRYLADEVVEARPASAGYRLRKLARRYRRAVGAAAAGAALLAVAAGVSVWQAVRATRAEGAATTALRLAEDERADKQAALDLARREGQTARDELAAREAVQRFFLDKVFAAGRPEGQDGGLGRDVTLRRAVDAAAADLGEAFRGRPAAEAAVRHVLGETYHFLAEDRTAVGQLDRAHRLRADLLGADHLDTLASLSALAAAYGRGADWAAAVRTHEQALSLYRARHGPDHPDTLASMTALGNAYTAIGKSALALPLHEQALAARRAQRGPDDPATLFGMVSLAGTYKAAGRVAEATRLFEDALAARRARFGPAHPGVLSGAAGLAAVYGEAGRYAEAARLLEPVVPVWRTRLGPSHPTTMNGLYNLAVALKVTGRTAEAAWLARERLGGLIARHGPASRQALAGAVEVARVYRLAGRPGEAVRLYEGVVAARQAAGPPDHPDLLADTRELAVALLEAGRPDRAVRLLADAVAGHRRRLPPGDAKLSDELAAAGAALVAHRRYADAEPVLRECVAARDAAAPDGWGTWNARSLLGAAVAGLGRPAEAEPLLTSAYAGMRRVGVPATSAAALPRAADRLVRFYETTGRPDEAARWRAERAGYPAERAPHPRPAASGR